MGKTNMEVEMLLALALILLIIALAGGVVVHPLLFLLAIVAILVLFTHREGRRGLVR